MTTRVASFAKASIKLDSEIRAVDETISGDKDATDEVKAVSKKAMTPVDHRQTLRHVA
mgnify:CR=1 FL=1